MMMSRLRSVAAGLFVLATGLVACHADRQPITAPAVTSAPRASLLGDVVGGVTGTVGNLTGTLLSCSVSDAYSATQVIGPSGGFIAVGPHSLFVPPGALDSNVKITATVPATRHAEVHFAPEGLKFNVPSSLNMSYAKCSLLVGLLPKIVYVDDNQNILESLLSLPNLFQKRVSAPIKHFSNYVVAF